MKLRFLTCLIGPETFVKPGQVVEIKDDEALRHIANGNAVEHVEQPVETATPPGGTTATTPAPTVATPPKPETAATRPAKAAKPAKPAPAAQTN